MPMNRTGWRTRLREVAVAVVLVVGAGATLATTAPPDECPSPPVDGDVSEFYGPQDYEGGMSRYAVPRTFLGAGGLDIDRAEVRADDCLTADTTDVSVTIHFQMRGEHVGAIPEETLRTLRVTDGRGRSWAPDWVDSRESMAQSSKEWGQYPALATIAFLLPIDLVSPVSLHLGDLQGPTVDVLSLDEAGPSEGPT